MQIILMEGGAHGYGWLKWDVVGWGKGFRLIVG
ncbi:hypothetical protein CBA19C6_09220 [Cupriavidus pauculus]|nr:hypothetical protein CBA19C6_09220 [Cupriavidus pauculus]